MNYIKRTTSIILIAFIALSVFTIQNVKANSEISEINIGYFPNITHAPAIVGISENIFTDILSGIKINTRIFPNGSLFMDALNTGQIDLGYVGPGPAINRFLQGAEITALASASTGGTVLVTRSDLNYNSVKDLEGKVVATAALGCTHDLLFRKLIHSEGMATNRQGGTIDHRGQKPATMVGLFATNQLDAAMVSEPWAARMEDDLGAKVVVDWNQVPWDGKLPATIIVSRNSFIEENQELIKSFLKANQQAIDFILKNPDKSAELLKNEIKKITRQELPLEVIKRSLARTKMTSELDSAVVQELADLSSSLGFIKGDSSLEGFINTSYLEDIIDEDSK